MRKSAVRIEVRRNGLFIVHEPPFARRILAGLMPYRQRGTKPLRVLQALNKIMKNILNLLRKDMRLNKLSGIKIPIKCSVMVNHDQLIIGSVP